MTLAQIEAKINELKERFERIDTPDCKVYDVENTEFYINTIEYNQKEDKIYASFKEEEEEDEEFGGDN